MASGTLYIVATPIGNLEDITYRAVRVLGEVDLIAAEDTRYTRKLLTHFGISKILTSYFDHNKAIKGQYILEQLAEGHSVALVTDAGTPCISDPGYQLVRDAVIAGIPVVPIPGASASVTALSASGLPSDAFVFEGFLPSRPGKRREKLASLVGEQRVLIFYESPGRLMATLKDVYELLGDREIVVARELTKFYEEFVRGKVSDVITKLAGRRIKGEIVIILSKVSTPLDGNVMPVVELLRKYIMIEGLTLKDAVGRVSVETCMPRSQVYSEALRIREP